MNFRMEARFGFRLLGSSIVAQSAWQDMAAHAPDNAYGELMADPREITSTSDQTSVHTTTRTGGTNQKQEHAEVPLQLPAGMLVT